MKKLNLIFAILIGLIITSCSSDDTVENNNSEKKLVKITYQDLSNQNQSDIHIIYDSNNNISEINDDDGLLLQKFTYNSVNKIIKTESYYYYNQILEYKDITSITYDANNKISTIIETYISYNTDGSISSQESTNHTFTYSNNSIIRLSDDFSNTKVEYALSNGLFTRIKVYRNNTLKSDMTFTYDSEGNCISGSGPINEGSLDSTTNNIELSVLYGSEEKNPIFNKFFDINILTRTSFYNLRQTLVDQQGNKYAEEIQWYQYSNYPYKETNENTFDNNGYILSKKQSEFPDHPNYGMTIYTWE